MLEVFLCCSPTDRGVAEVIAAHLEGGAEVRVALDASETGTVAVKWEGGLSSAAILLLLSPEAVPPNVGRADWGAVLDHITRNAVPPVGSLLVRDCGYPRLLERKRFFRWEHGPRNTLRDIQKWALTLHQLPRERSFLPASLPWFEGRENELEMLWERLVDCAGAAFVVNPAAASGKTSLAHEFSRRAAAHFRDIMWIACGDRSPASIAANLANQMGVTCEGDVGEAFARLIDLGGEHRVLIVLDDLQPAVAIPDRHGRASVLVTSRSTPVKRAPAAQIIRIGNLPEFRSAAPGNPVDLRLWRAMTVCCPSGFPLELAVQIAGIEPADAQEACVRLIQSRMVDPMDDSRGWMRLSAISAAAADTSLDSERSRHAEIVFGIASEWRAQPDFSKRYISEFMPAFRWEAGGNWPLACGIIRHAFALLRHYGRLAEGAELLVALRDAAEQRCEWEVSDECSWELSWIRGVPYRAANRTPVAGDQFSLDFGA